MSRRIATVAVGVTLLACGLSGPAAEAQQRRGRVAAPRLTEETLVPTELFAEADAKRFGYPDGFSQTYTRTDTGHVWNVVERSLAEPAPADASSPTPTPEPTLPPSSAEESFTSRVAFLRPTFVTLVFASDAAAASDMVQAFLDEESNESARPANLAVFALERITNLAPASSAVLYNREFNLGPKSGGFRRGSTIVFAKGSIFVKVEAFWGLKDGALEAEFESLERRARAVASYLLRKM